MYLVNNLLNQETFIPFNFSNDFKEVCEKNDLDGISSGEYILLKKNPDDFLKILMHDNHVCYLYLEEILVSSETSLAAHGIYPAKRLSHNALEDNHHSIMKDYNLFCLTIFQKEYWWLKQFLNWIHHYLEKRVAFGEVLTKHESIRFSLSEVIENMAIAHMILQKQHVASHELKIFSNLLLKATKKLANCTGGRGFSGGNILEFYYITQLVNHFLCQ
jgi:hypothetical protein